MDRSDVARWLLEKLLGSFVISGIFVWGPLIGIKINNYGIGTVYSIVTSISLLISLIVYILVPKEFETLTKLKSFKIFNKTE